MLRFVKITLAAVTALAVAGLAACSSVNTAAGSTISIAASVESSGQTSEQKTVYGKVTAVNGNSITVAVGTLNDNTATASGSDTSGADSSATASGSDTSGLLTLTGHTLIFTVTDSTEYSSIGIAGQTSEADTDSASSADITMDSVLEITYNTRTSEAVSVAILTGNAIAQPADS